LAFGFGLFPISRVYLWDEAVYLATAENLFASTPYFTEISFRPPLLPLLLNLGAHLMSIDLFAHILAAAFFAAGVLLIYLLGSKLFGKLSGLIAAGLMLLSPFFLTWSHRVLSDIPSMTLALGSLYFLFRHIEDEKGKAWNAALAGVLLASSVLMRFVLILMGICAVYFFLRRCLRFRYALWYGAGFAATLAPYLVWAQIRQGSFVKPFLLAMWIVGAGSEPVPYKLYYLEATYLVAAPVAVLGLGFYVCALFRRQAGNWWAHEFPLVLWYAGFTLYLTTVSHKEIRYVLPAIPALFLLAGHGLASLQSKRVVLVTAALVSLSAAFMIRRVSYFDGRESWVEGMLAYSAETRPAALYLQEHMTAEQVIYSNHLWPVIAYYSKRKTLDLWPRDESFYRVYPRNLKQDGYLVVYEGVGKEPSRDWLDRNPEFHQVQQFGHVIVYEYKAAIAAVGEESASASSPAKGGSPPPQSR
jgi:4-amino-4-deoxy-L-arabinose transferase-like glycosyltransferase